MFFFMRVLCNYQDQSDNKKAKEDEEFKQDKIVIYNEIIDVMRSVLHMFYKKEEAAR